MPIHKKVVYIQLFSMHRDATMTLLVRIHRAGSKRHGGGCDALLVINYETRYTRAKEKSDVSNPEERFESPTLNASTRPLVAWFLSRQRSKNSRVKRSGFRPSSTRLQTHTNSMADFAFKPRLQPKKSPRRGSRTPISRTGQSNNHIRQAQIPL